MSARNLILAAGAISFMLLAGAFAFEYLGGLAPCKLCIWQRWPHGIAILAAGFAWFFLNRALIALGGLAALSTAGVGLYHGLVERGVFQGPQNCTSGDISSLTPSELLQQIMAAPLVRCDEVAWAMWGISMAEWNAIFSAIAALLWCGAWLKLRKAPHLSRQG